MNDIYEDIIYDDLPQDLQLLSDTCGLETVRHLLRHCSSTFIYIPRMAKLKKFIIRYLDSHYEKGFKRISREIGVSEQYLRNIHFDQKHIGIKQKK
jgi:hypothetical protein